MSKKVYENSVISSVLGHSVSKDYDKAKLEWGFTGDVNDYGPLKDQKPVKKCQLCGHPIRFGYILKNSKNNKKVEVGSECVCNYLNVTPQLEGRMELVKASILEKAKKAKKEAAKKEKLAYNKARGWAAFSIMDLIKIINKTTNYKDQAAIGSTTNNPDVMYKNLKSGVVFDMAKKYNFKLNMAPINDFMKMYEEGMEKKYG